MSEIVYEIDGKEYTEDEIMRVYKFWRNRCDTEDINDAINHIIEYDHDEELSQFVKDNSNMIKNACIEHLPFWHDIQRDTLNSSDESIFDFALQLIYCIYCDKEGKVPS